MLKGESLPKLEESVPQTGGLPFTPRLVGTTSSEIFSFQSTTSMEINLRDFNQLYEKIPKKEKIAKGFLKEFKSIVKDKLKKPIDLKRLYYEQFEHDIF